MTISSARKTVYYSLSRRVIWSVKVIFVLLFRCELLTSPYVNIYVIRAISFWPKPEKLESDWHFAWEFKRSKFL